MARKLSYKDKYTSGMRIDEQYTIEYLEKLPRDIVRVELPDGVAWRRTHVMEGRSQQDSAEKERVLIDAISEADQKVKRAKRFINLTVSTLVGTLGLILFFAGVELPGYMSTAGFWIFILILIVELIIVVIAFFLALNDGDNPWDDKRRAERNYRDWLAKGE
jgi:uncharacterized membrane protein